MSQAAQQNVTQNIPSATSCISSPQGVQSHYCHQITTMINGQRNALSHNYT